jgi:hypothetical protein
MQLLYNNKVIQGHARPIKWSPTLPRELLLLLLLLLPMPKMLMLTLTLMPLLSPYYSRILRPTQKTNKTNQLLALTPA